MQGKPGVRGVRRLSATPRRVEIGTSTGAEVPENCPRHKAELVGIGVSSAWQPGRPGGSRGLLVELVSETAVIVRPRAQGRGPLRQLP